MRKTLLRQSLSLSKTPTSDGPTITILYRRQAASWPVSTNHRDREVRRPKGTSSTKISSSTSEKGGSTAISVDTPGGANRAASEDAPRDGQ